MEIKDDAIYFSEWTQLVKHLTVTKDNSKIYRGHSNDFGQKPRANNIQEFIDGARGTTAEPHYWKLISSFDRFYNGRYPFGLFLSQQLENNNFHWHYKNYNYNFIGRLLNCNHLERIYFLQHYGIPTCFIDFTKNPLIALYFAISTVRTSPTYTPDSKGNPVFYPSKNLFISLFEINHEKISEILNPKPIDKSFSYMTYGRFKMSHGIHFAFDIDPLNNIEGFENHYNLKKQEGCFVLFDKGSKKYELDTFIRSELNERGISYTDLLKEYRLNYNEIFVSHDIDNLGNINLFSYLCKKNISGKILFDDIQGLKYDLNFFHYL